MNIKCELIKKVEIVHYYDIKTQEYLYSRGNVFWGRIGGRDFQVKIPLKNLIWKIIIKFRLFRRVLRLDKSNMSFTANRKYLIIIYLGEIYRFEIEKKLLEKVHKLENSRNTLHMGFLYKNGYFYIGEYGNKNKNKRVPIWRGEENGKYWKKIYSFPPNKIKHIHGIYSDEYSNNIWITTGDFLGQCWLIKTDNDFSQLKYYGDGSQKYRTVNMIFTNKYIVWGMDSLLEKNFLYLMNRNSEEIRRVDKLNLRGPIWYMKKLEDGFLVQTSVEKGKGVTTKEAKIYFSKDLFHWKEIIRFKKDFLPMPYFKNGIVSFSEGIQTSKEFYIFGEGLINLEGKSKKCRIEYLS